MTLVDDGRSSLETAPDLLTDLLGYRTNALPFLVHLLKTAECRKDVTCFWKFLGLFAECFFLLKVLLEIIVAKFLVDLESVIELLSYCAESLPENIDFLRIDGTNFLELLLKILEDVVLLTNTIGIRSNGIHLVENLILLCKVFSHLLVACFDHDGTSFFLDSKELFQFRLQVVGLRLISSWIAIVIDKLLKFCINLLLTNLVIEHLEIVDLGLRLLCCFVSNDRQTIDDLLSVGIELLFE